MSYGSKTLEVSQHRKSSVEVPNWTSEGWSETKVTLTHILKVPALIPAQLPHEIVVFSIGIIRR